MTPPYFYFLQKRIWGGLSATPKNLDLFGANSCYSAHAVRTGINQEKAPILFDPAWLFKCRMGIGH
jgi:hypothetical protein